MLDKVVIANRGEIARRIRAPAKSSDQTVAVHSTADWELKHVLLADETICIGQAASGELHDVLADYRRRRGYGAVAIHPGYGFLSETPTSPKWSRNPASS
ncbi:biotin carboxylase N-terminal domain-containing protein [Shigella flexneri]